MTETAEFWKKHNYELVLTEDQSPTLRWLGSENLETMHHRGGAYSETQLIYGEPLRESLKAGGRSALSVGLGLGYNEVLVATEALKFQIPPQDFKLLSFESDPFLSAHFLLWVNSTDTNLIYDQIFQFFKDANLKEVKHWLQAARDQGSWILEGALTPETEFSNTYECIFYDAFSSKTSPYLWQEDFLKEFLRRVSAPETRVSTYACTGAFKRALKANQFQVLLKEGFHSKRDRTMGLKTTAS
jgi:tRNA U34 5-methylaminomethyl-2-thiouridine-forming methyltransferase MnmC